MVSAPPRYANPPKLPVPGLHVPPTSLSHQRAPTDPAAGHGTAPTSSVRAVRQGLASQPRPIASHAVIAAQQALYAALDTARSLQDDLQHLRTNGLFAAGTATPALSEHGRQLLGRLRTGTETPMPRTTIVNADAGEILHAAIARAQALLRSRHEPSAPPDANQQACQLLSSARDVLTELMGLVPRPRA